MNSKYSNKYIPALVIGGDVSALNVIRSLGRRGIKIYVMGNHPKEYGPSSRYAEFVHCKKLTDEESVVSKMLEISHHFRRKMVVYCTSDLHVLYVSRNRELLGKFYDFVLPEHQVIEMLMDKKNFYEFATHHGYCVPKTFFSNNRTNLETIAHNISYPCVVKPLYRTRFWSDHIPPQKKVIKVDSSMHLQRELEKLGALDQPLILQEWIPGNDQQVYFGLAYFSREGVPLGIMTGRKLRQYPSLTGVTSLAESIEHQKVSELTLEILKTAGCRGLCSVEFKLNPIDNSFQITEPTVGRVDLQEGISTHAGLDLPFIAYQDAIGISQSGKTDFKTGLKWINEPFEFNTLITRIRGDRNGIVKFFFPYRGHLSFALFARDDPMPFIRFLIWGGNRAFLYLKNLSQ